jgi:hypothetical protein
VLQILGSIGLGGWVFNDVFFIEWDVTVTEFIALKKFLLFNYLLIAIY